MHELSILGNTGEQQHNVPVYSSDWLCLVLSSLNTGKAVINWSRSSRGGQGLELLLCKGALRELDPCSLEKGRLNCSLPIPTQKSWRSWRQTFHSSTWQDDRQWAQAEMREAWWKTFHHEDGQAQRRCAVLDVFETQWKPGMTLEVTHLWVVD